MDLVTSFAWVLAGLLVALVIWIWKLVTTPPPAPVLVLGVTPPSVETGQAVTFAGTLTQGGSPLASKTVSLAVTPPLGDGYALSSITNSSGVYSLTWTVPAGSSAGTWTVAVGYSGANGVSKTFIQVTVVMGNRIVR